MNFETIAAYLAGECNQAEKQAVDQWRKESIHNEQDFQRWQLLWQASQNINPNITVDTAKAWQKINPEKNASKSTKSLQEERPSKHRNILVWMRNIAAIFLLVIGMGWGVWQVNWMNTSEAVQMVERTGSSGMANKFILSDGTTIWLNAQSKLRYPEQFDRDSREVFLEGEAYFEVFHDPKKPFLIHTQGSVTEVLGTSFTVRSYVYEPTIEVNLLSGKVSFSLQDSLTQQKVIVKPKQKAILNKADQRISVVENEDQNFLAWKTHQLIFKDVALSKALQTLEAYYGVDFIVSDTVLLNCRFTGSFNQAPLEDVLQVFAFGSDISYRKQGEEYILSGTGCK
jgi:ferric-dicitrate binding protein FerR (iron transport regulator)